MNSHRVFVVSDVHFDNHHPGAIKALEQVVKDRRLTRPRRTGLAIVKVYDGHNALRIGVNHHEGYLLVKQQGQAAPRGALVGYDSLVLAQLL